MVFFRSAFYTPEDSGLAFKDFDYTRLSLDLDSISIVWNLEEKVEGKAVISLGLITDGSGSAFSELSCRLVLDNLRQDSKGELVIIQGATQLSLQFPEISQGNMEVSNDLTVLTFRFVDGILYWDSNQDSATHTISDPTITLSLAPDGTDDDNWQTPFRNPNQLIKVLKRKAPYTTGYPAEDSGYVGDRYIGATIYVSPGTYNHTWFLQYLNRYGIDIIGLGEPGDVIFFGDEKNDAIKIMASTEINFQNITFNSNRSGIYMLHSQDINITDCRFIIRSSSPRNAVFCSRNSRAILKGNISLDATSNFRRLVNSSYESTVEIGCELMAFGGNTINFSDSFLHADAEARIYAESLSVAADTVLGGLAADIKRGGRIYMPAEPINNLVYV